MNVTKYYKKEEVDKIIEALTSLEIITVTKSDFIDSSTQTETVKTSTSETQTNVETKPVVVPEVVKPVVVKPVTPEEKPKKEEVVMPTIKAEPIDNATPYVSTYFINPKLDKEEEAVINYYVTDHAQTEYVTDNATKEFVVLYSIDGKEKSVKVKGGDNSINLGKLSLGKKMLTLQVVDNETGAKSHKLFIEFLVVDTKAEEIKESETFRPTADELLKAYKIHGDNTNPIETTKGLNDMLIAAKAKGYKKVVLPKATYRIDENSSVFMQENVTLDLNGSTLKQNPNALCKTMIVRFLSVNNAHLINGILEGDKKEHDYAKAEKNSEWCNGVSIDGSSSYCSVENVVVKEITGYGCNCGLGGTMEKPTMYTYDSPITIEAKDFVHTTINEKGEEVKCDIRVTSKNFVDVEKFVKSAGFIQVGAYLGYQGCVLKDTWRYDAHFYDKDKKYIGKVEGYLYRKLIMPSNAKYVKITGYTSNLPRVSIFNFRTPTNIAYKKVTMENNRAVGMALASFNHMLVEDCTFINCGETLAKCALDAEDGWDMMQDLTFRSNHFEKNPNNEFLTCGGHNFVIENNKDIELYFWDRTNGYVVRNNTIKKDCNYKKGSLVRTGYTRVYNNVYTCGGPIVTLVDKNNFICRDEKIINGYCFGYNNYYSEGYRIKFINSELDHNTLDIKLMVNTSYDKCIFKGVKAYISNCTEITNSKLENCTDLRLHTDAGELIRAKKTETPKFFNGNTFINCEFKKQGNTLSEYEKCIFENTSFATINKKDAEVITFTNCKWDAKSKSPQTK